MENENNTNIVLTSKIKGPNFIDLSIKNFGLGIVTLTLYRFWGITNVRKRIWNNNFLNNEPFEYTGKGGELFKGFLIGLVVFVIPYLAFIFGLQLLPPVWAGLISIPFLIFIYLVMGAAVWLSIRYMASRTVWRGIRFGLHGKPMEFAFSFLGQLFLTIITFGWYSPKMTINLSNKLLSGLSFGDKRFEFADTKEIGENVYKYFAIYWFAIMLTYVGFAMIFMPLFNGGSEIFLAEDPEVVAGLIAKIYGAIFIFLIIAIIASLPYQAAIQRAVFKRLSIDNVKFRSEIKAFPLFLQILVNSIIIILSFGILMPVVLARNARFILTNIKAEGHLDFDTINQGEKGPTHGEGLTDALELDIGII